VGARARPYANQRHTTALTKFIGVTASDFRKIMVERKGEKNFFTSEMIKQCMHKG
jgi:hypothetical protein